jgi:hypothetical protein
MPFLVRPSIQRFRNFMLRPNTYNLDFSTGDRFYFSMPFDIESLSLMSSQELQELFDFMSDIQDDVTNKMGQPGLDNLLSVQRMILYQLKDTQALSPMEEDAWQNGDGLPVFDIAENLVGFVPPWNSNIYDTMRAHESYQQNHGPFDANSHDPEGFNQDGISVLHWEKNGHEAFEWRRNGETVQFCIYGGRFKAVAEWERFLHTLTHHELDLRDEGVLVTRNIPYGGWGLEYSSGYRLGHSESTFDGQDPARHRDVSAFSTPYYEGHSHQGQEEVSPYVYPCDETCCCTPLQLPSPPLNTPTSGSEAFRDTTSHQSDDIDKSVRICGATFRNMDDSVEFPHTLTKVDLDLLGYRVLRLEGSSDTGIKMTLGSNTGSLIEQAQAHTILRDQFLMDMDATSRNGVRTETRTQAEPRNRQSGQHPSSHRLRCPSQSCPGHYDFPQSMQPTSSGRTASARSAEGGDLEGSDFTEVSGLGIFQAPIEVHPAPHNVHVRPSPRVIHAHPVLQVIPTRRAHHRHGPEPRYLNVHQPSNCNGGQLRSDILQQPPRTSALQPPSASPQTVIGPAPNHRVLYSAHTYPDEARQTTISSYQPRIERTKTSLAKTTNEQGATSKRNVPTHVVETRGQAARDVLQAQIDKLLSLQWDHVELIDRRRTASLSNQEQRRTSRDLRASQRASDPFTNQVPHVSSAPQSTSSRYQAYAEDSPEDLTQPSPNSWRDV